MSLGTYDWRLRYQRKRRIQEPGAPLFRGVRMRLTFWYCGVFGTVLVIMGVALYISSRYFLLNPIESDAQNQAIEHTNQWFQGSPGPACPLSGPPDQGPNGSFGQRFFAIVCFDQHGALLPEENTAGLPTAFLSNTLAQQALQAPTRDAHDIVNGEGSIGLIYRYARVVPGPSGNENAGIVVVGESIQAQEDELTLLLTLLLSFGGTALLCAGLGGLFLANRALAPARLAWTNQQRFLADASHELRTPLALMRADAEVLLRGREHLEEDDVVLLEDIVVEVNHMGNITTNLLTLARLDNGFSHPEHEVINLAKLAGEMVRRVQALADQRAITVQEEHTGNPYIIGDSMQLEQAALVLLDNAIKYNRLGGTITLHTSVQDGRALLEVRDSGIGIAAEHLPNLGERFYRVDKARSRAAGGTGLGLSIARGIASTHGGRLTLASIPEQGTTATLILPLAYEKQHKEM